MRHKWANFYKGYVKIKISGKLLEPFLNQCTKGNISIWEVKKPGETTITGYVLLEDVKKMKGMCKQYHLKMAFIERQGMPFIFKKMRQNQGFMIGMLLTVIIIFILSNMVWNINVEGANPKIEHEIRKELTEMGITRGKFQFLLPNVEDIQSELSERIDMATWIGVERSGTSYRLQVVEKKQPEEQELTSPRHLVAKKKGVVTDFFIEQGEPQVEVNDFVQKGDLLVSGIIGKDENTEIVSAKGQVFAEIWYKAQAVVPLKTTFEVLTGKNQIKHYITLGGLEVPVWGFGAIKFAHAQVSDEVKHFNFLHWTLPVTYKQTFFREKEQVTRTYKPEEAKKVGIKIAKNKLKEKLQDDSIIKNEKILHQTVQDGKVKLQIKFQVIEDIAVASPIIQGD